MLKNFLLKMLLSAVFIMFFSIKFIDVTVGEVLYEYPLETAWKATGLKLAEVSTEGWMKVNDNWMDSRALRELAQDIIRQFKLKLHSGLSSGGQDEFGYVSFQGAQPDGTIITVTIQTTRSDGFCETQLGFNTIHNGQIQNLRRYIETIKAKLAGLGSDLNFSVQFQGERAGKLSPALVKNITGKVFRKIKAETVSSAFEGNDSSQLGYTKLIKDSIKFDSQPVNIELFASYDESRNITQVSLATPNFTGGV